ncbi:MAG: hypothetical protein HY859_02995 [Caulobacterales bacterium]|nr:hypothetical protein [Caulobacterales bacterium]
MTYSRTLNGTAGNNFLFGDSRNEQINGLGGGDSIFGNGGSDRLDGGTGNDSLNGGEGDDILIGGTGNDSLTGGAGADVFVFGASTGNDTIVDFVVGVDLIDVSQIGSVQSITQQAGGALVTFSSGSSALLTGVAATALSSASFLGLIANAMDAAAATTAGQPDSKAPLPDELAGGRIELFKTSGDWFT